VNRPEEELYDVVNDPDEVKNLAKDREHAKALVELRKKVLDWQKKTGDPWTIKNEHE
jgi:N-sulfoglucosamine sulfohydrolase